MSASSILAAIAIMALLLGVHYWEKRKLSRRQPDEEELVFLLARLEETSEFEQFRRAGQQWNIPEQRIEADFKRYLLSSFIPVYVRSYIRKKCESMPDIKRIFDEKFDSMIRPPGPGSNLP